MWMPDLFFSNEKEGHFHNIIMPNVYIRIFPNGSVLYSIRISLTLACPMNLKLYPLDRQICSLRMASCKCELRNPLKGDWLTIYLNVYCIFRIAFCAHRWLDDKRFGIPLEGGRPSASGQELTPTSLHAGKVFD